MKGTMFQPLTEAEVAAGQGGHQQRDADEWQPIIPPPQTAPATFRHGQLGEAFRKFPYHNADDELEGYQCRFNFVGEDGEPGKTFRPHRYGTLNGKTGWHWKGWGAGRPLYRLPVILANPDKPILVVEGEGKADAAQAVFPDYLCTAPMNGAKSPHLTNYSPCEGRSVRVMGDNDTAGRSFADVVAKHARDAGAASVAIVEVPAGFPPKWDFDNEPPEGWDVPRLRGLLESARPYEAARAPAKLERHNGPFQLRPDGVYKRTDDKNGNNELKRICSHLEVAADTRDANSEDWGRLLVVTDRDGRRHEWAMPMAMLAGDGATYRERLLSLGLELAPGRTARHALHEYISTARPEATARCVSRIGWHDRAYVLPDATFGESGSERVLLQTATADDNAFRVSGTLEDWQALVARYCVGNSRLALAVAAALAAPLLYVTGEESGGLHFVGQSRTGKTTTLRVAGSVWGGGGINGFLKTWRATSNGLEATAAQHCDALLCLDEMGQVDAREAGEVAYMLANGSGKSRARRDGSGRPRAQWRVLFLSTGELGLADKMNEGGKRPRAGQEVRLADVPADAEAGLGIFEELHGIENADAFARHLRDTTGQCYGTAARAYLERVTALEPSELRDGIAQARKEFIAAYVPADADGQVLSVAGRFAMVAAAGELATHFGITGWPAGTAGAAAAVCLKAWLERRGGAGAAEIRAGLAQIRKFFEAHGTARFEPMGADVPTDSQGAPVELRIINRAGFRRRDNENRWEYLVLPETFRTELCAGFDPRIMVRELRRQSLLIPDQGDDKTQARHKLPGLGTKRVYHFAAAIMGGARCLRRWPGWRNKTEHLKKMGNRGQPGQPKPKTLSVPPFLAL